MFVVELLYRVVLCVMGRPVQCTSKEWWLNQWDCSHENADA